MPDLNARVVRRSLRALVLTPAVLLPLVSVPAFAVPPQSWPTAKSPSAFDFLLVLFIIPLGLGLLITLLVLLPSMIRGQRSSKEPAFSKENEWFGGPKDGVKATEGAPSQPAEAAGERGGASGRW